MPDKECSLQPEKKKKKKNKKTEVGMIYIRPSNFVYPKTAYDGHIPSMPRYAEKGVLQDILVGERIPPTLIKS